MTFRLLFHPIVSYVGLTVILILLHTSILHQTSRVADVFGMADHLDLLYTVAVLALFSLIILLHPKRATLPITKKVSREDWFYFCLLTIGFISFLSDYPSLITLSRWQIVSYYALLGFGTWALTGITLRIITTMRSIQP